MASKCDAVSDPDRLEAIRAAARRRGLPYREISAATRLGLEDLVRDFFRLAGARDSLPALSAATGPGPAVSES